MGGVRIKKKLDVVQSYRTLRLYLSLSSEYSAFACRKRSCSESSFAGVEGGGVVVVPAAASVNDFGVVDDGDEEVVVGEEEVGEVVVVGDSKRFASMSWNWICGRTVSLGHCARARRMWRWPLCE